VVWARRYGVSERHIIPRSIESLNCLVIDPPQFFASYLLLIDSVVAANKPSERDEKYECQSRADYGALPYAPSGTEDSSTEHS